MSFFRKQTVSQRWFFPCCSKTNPLNTNFYFFQPREIQIPGFLYDKDRLLRKLNPERDSFAGIWVTPWRQVIGMAITCKRKFDPGFEYFSWFEIGSSFRKQSLTPWFVHEFLLELGTQSKLPIKVWPIPPAVKLACYTIDHHGYEVKRDGHFLILTPLFALQKKNSTISSHQC